MELTLTDMLIDPVQEGVDITIRRGEALGVVGPNGAGKTTLFGVLAGTLPASEGQVFFEGQDISAWPAAARCRHGIARTHQVPRPFLGMSVLENNRWKVVTEYINTAAAK